MVTLFGVEVYL